MQLNEEGSIFFDNNDIVIQGYCLCDLYYISSKQVNFQKRKAHYIQIFYLTSRYGLYQVFISEEFNICDIDHVPAFEMPNLIIEEKLEENFSIINYHYYSNNKYNALNNKNKKDYAFIYPIDSEYDLYMFDFKDVIVSIDESNYTEVNTYIKKKLLVAPLNEEDFQKYVLTVKVATMPAGTLDAKLNDYKQQADYNSNNTDNSGGVDMTIYIDHF